MNYLIILKQKDYLKYFLGVQPIIIVIFTLWLPFQKEIAAHKNATKGGAFKLNMHPRAYFDPNPYVSDRPGRRGGSAGLPTKKDDSKPFKPSSPGKKVTKIRFVPQPLYSKAKTMSPK